MNKFLIYLTLLFLLSRGTFVIAQNSTNEAQFYLWPTNASKFLTSVFCEYRGRRFHAGIDVKTWGKIGYNVYAIRPGYVSRISVSPYGYGRALYIKLDTGETAVFAHLSRFSDPIQDYVESEQKRLGRYRINRYLKKGQLPVAHGEIVAYTGQTGIGAPHLHFEIRDSANKPINPLSKGYNLPDRVSPIITKLSFSPLDVSSEVNGDYKPVILYPQWSNSGEYVINEVVTIWGNVGLAISSYDKDANSSNLFGPYSFKLLVDDVVRFQYQYDQMSFQENTMVELERDYRLSRRQFGRFHKLYKGKHNVKSNYTPNKTWAGVLKSASLDAIPEIRSKYSFEKALDKNDFQAGALFPGMHEFKIEVSDYFGNISIIRGKFQVGAAYNIQPIIRKDEAGMLILNDILTYELRRLENVNAFELNRNRWRSIPLDFIYEEDSLEESNGKNFDSGLIKSGSVLLLEKPLANPIILKFIGHDQFEFESYPYFYIESHPISTSKPAQFEIGYDYYDDYLRLEIQSKNLLRESPELILNPEREDSVKIQLQQIELNKYVGRIDFNSLNGSYHLLKIISQNLSGEEFINWEHFEATIIKPSKSKRIISEDQKFWVSFWSGSLYKPIYARILVDSLTNGTASNMVSQIYNAEPQDVLLNAGANVVLKYPHDEIHPEKLGVYYYTTKSKWTFIDNTLDTTNKTISAKVFSLEKFVLIRDEIPPEISNLRLGNQAHLKSRTPRISAKVEDKLSGIKSENDIVIRLNGKRLIAEYDPERDRIFYQFKKPLPKGKYEASVWAQDRSKNDAFRKTIFWID